MTDPQAPVAQSTTTTPQDTSDVYDRQIRLWGADAQSKISSATILYINITGVSSEILKNLVLAGVKPVICDGRPYPDAVQNTPSSFFLPEDPPFANTDNDTNGTEEKKSTTTVTTVAAAIKSRVLELNPFLSSIEIDERPLSSIPNSELARFDVIIASRLSPSEATRVASATTAAGGLFYLVDTYGLVGAAALDLGPTHTFKKEVGKDKLSEATKAACYVSMEEIMGCGVGECTGRWDKVCPKEWAAYRVVLAYREEMGRWPDEAREGSDDGTAGFVDFAKKYLSAASLDTSYLGDDDALSYLAQGYEYAPVCAVLGGVVGNEVIKALSGKGEPANNVLLFDGESGGCRSFLVKKK